MLTLTPYVRSAQKRLKRWLLEPGVRLGLRATGYFALGVIAAGGALMHRFLPLGLSLCCVFTGWAALLVGLGSCAGYLWLWGGAGWQAVAWVLSGLLVTAVFADRKVVRQTPLLLPAVAALIAAAWGVVWQNFYADATPVAVYLLRVALAFGSLWVLRQVVQGRDPVCEWIGWGFAALCLAQFGFVSWLNPG